MRFRSSQGGYTMIQTIAFIAILALVGSSAVSVLSKALSRYKVSRLTQQVVELQRAIDRKYVAKREYTGLTLAVLHSGNLLPSDMNYSNGVLYHKLGGTVTVAPNGELYTITFNNVPKYACMELAEQNWGLDPRIVLDSMKVGNNNLKWRCSGGNCYTMPLSVSDANTVCAAGNNNISWTFY